MVDQNASLWNSTLNSPLNLHKNKSQIVITNSYGMSSMQDSLPDEFEDLDFEILEEGWNTYELSDGVTIRARTILKKIFADPMNPNKYGFDTLPTILSVSAPLANRGEKNNAPDLEEYKTLPSYETKINQNNEPFNIYRIMKNGQVVKLKLVVTKISRVVDRFDNYGLPIYLVNSGPMVHIEKENPTHSAGQ